MINGIHSLSRKAAKEAKQYFGELHMTILESFRGLFDDLEGNLQQHIENFGSNVDGNDSAVFKSDYLQDVKLRIWRNRMKSSMIKSKKCPISLPLLPHLFSDVDEWKKSNKETKGTV